MEIVEILRASVSTFFAQRPGYSACATYTEQIGDSGQHDKTGIHYRNSCCLLRSIQPSNKIGIRQVIDQGDHLAGDWRQNLRNHSPVDRRMFQKFPDWLAVSFQKIPLSFAWHSHMPVPNSGWTPAALHCDFLIFISGCPILMNEKKS
mgnify:CR=1 FL=1